MQTNYPTSTTGTSGSDKLLSFKATRAIVGVSRSKIYELLQEDAFPEPVKVGRNNYFSQQEIQSWIKSQLDMRSRLREGE